MMSNITSAVPMKNIVFIRNDKEKVISINPTNTSEDIRNTITAAFGLPLNSQPALENVNTNVILCGIQAATLCSDPNANPTYRVFISEDQQSEIHWCRRWWQQFILPFLMLTWDFCVNVLAGVVASTIFIEDNKLLKGRTFWCVLLIIVLKIITNKLSRKYAAQKLNEFMENARPAAPIPTGART